jgi:hypothetical protein
VTGLTDLPVIPVTRVVPYDAAQALLGSPVPEVTPTINRACLLTDDATGEPLLAYYPMPVDDVERLRGALTGIPWNSLFRSKTGSRNHARTFGMAPRRVSIRRESCRPTWLAVNEPARHDVLVDLAGRLQAQMLDFAPGAYAQAMKGVQVVPEEWRMAEDSLWTSGVVNKSSSLPYHRDRLNFPDTWAAMPVLRRNMTGGHLHIPEFGVSVQCRDGWVVTFPGYRYVHGVTPMKATADGGYRYSVVYYALRGMKDCATYAEELGEGQRNRTEREAHLAAVIRGDETSRLTR